MRRARSAPAFALVALAFAGACPPFDDLEYPVGGEGEGEAGEGEGEACAPESQAWQLGPSLAAVPIGLAPFDDGRVAIADAEGGVHLFDPESGSVTPATPCPTVRPREAHVSSASGVVFASGLFGLCAATEAEVLEHPVPTFSADSFVGSAILGDSTAQPLRFVVASAGPDDASNLRVQIVSFDGQAFTEEFTEDIGGEPGSDATPVVRRVGDSGDVLVGKVNGQLFLVPADSDEVIVAAVASAELFAEIGVASGAAGAFVLVRNATDSSVEHGEYAGDVADLASRAVVERAGLFSAGELTKQIIATPAGRFVHVGEFGYAAEQATAAAPLRPIAVPWRAVNVLVLAPSPNGALWGVTLGGEVLRWASVDEALAGAVPLAVDTRLLATGPLLVLEDDVAFVGGADAVARIELVAGALEVAAVSPPTFERGIVRAILPSSAPESLRVARADGSFLLHDIATLDEEGAETVVPVDDVAPKLLMAAHDPIASTLSTTVFWVVRTNLAGTAVVLRRCEDTAGTMTCGSDTSALAVPTTLGEQQVHDAFVIGDQLVAMLRSELLLYDITDHAVLPGPPTLASLPPGVDPWNDVHGRAVVAGRCLVVGGTEVSPFVVDLDAPSTLDAQGGVVVDPPVSAMVRATDGALFGMGPGAALYRIEVDDADCNDPLVGIDVVTPPRPELRITSAIAVGEDIWVGEISGSGRLWHLPACP